MLILTRRTGETINIGNDVTITVLNVAYNQVRIGIEAPKDIEVHREEIYNKIHKTKSNVFNEKFDRDAQETYFDLAENEEKE